MKKHRMGSFGKGGRKKAPRKGRVAAACYGLAALLWLGVALFHFVGDRARPPQALDLSAATLENLALQPDGRYLAETVDPQLIFEGLDQKVRLVRLAATFEHDPGELELFYLRAGQAGFSAGRRVVGMPQDDGTVLYALPPGTVHGLRLDPGTAGGSLIAIDEITLNPVLPAAHYFVPTLRQLLAFALLPALALCVFYTIIEMMEFVTRRRKKPGAAGSEA